MNEKNIYFYIYFLSIYIYHTFGDDCIYHLGEINCGDDRTLCLPDQFREKFGAVLAFCYFLVIF